MLNLIPLFVSVQDEDFEVWKVKWIHWLSLLDLLLGCEKSTLIQVLIQVLDNKIQTVFANLGSFWTNFKKTWYTGLIENTSDFGNKYVYDNMLYLTETGEHISF